MSIDTLYRDRLNAVEKFRFDDRVAGVFDNMISRSVPGYQQVQELTGAIARQFASPGTAIYDLGCSTGTTLIELAQILDDPSVTIVGIDSSSAMLVVCQQKIDEFVFRSRITLQNRDFAECELQNASVVIINYTLQFVVPDKREALLSHIYGKLLPGGVIILTEKVCFDAPAIHELIQELHVNFKRKNHYSDLEIAQKREAIETVLVPLTVEENLRLLRNAGFHSPSVICQWLNFAMMIAVK